MLKLWMNPLRPVEENLEVADGEIDRLRLRIEALEAEIEELKDVIRLGGEVVDMAERERKQLASAQAEINRLQRIVSGDVKLTAAQEFICEQAEKFRKDLIACQAENRKLRKVLGDGSNHPNDDEPHNEACEELLDRMGDNVGQGLNPFFKWSFRRGYNAALSTPSDTTALTEYTATILPNFLHAFKRHVGGDGEFWLHELEDFYEEYKKCNS